MITAEIAVIFSPPGKQRKLKYRTIASIPPLKTGSCDEAAFYTLHEGQRQNAVGSSGLRLRRISAPCI